MTNENHEIEEYIGDLSKIDICTALFKKKDFDFIVNREAINNFGDYKIGDQAIHKKQKQALNILTDNQYDQFLYGGAAGGSKGFCVNELVLTPFGFKEIGKLKIGSNICSTDGTVQQVINKVENGVIDFYRLTFADGTWIDCDYSHIWLGWDKEGRKIKNKDTCGESGMKKWATKDIYTKFKKTNRAITIPLTEPVVFNVAGSLYGSGNFVKRDLDPYTLGVILGDGCITGKSVSFYTPDHSISDRIKKKYDLSYYKHKTKENQGNYTFIGKKGKEVKEYLKTIKLMGKYSHNKFIPKIYLHGSIQERWDLLNGLMDTDGYADADGDSFYSTSSEQLSKDITYLARSLGCFVTNTVSENPFYTDVNGDKVYCRPSYKSRIKSKTPEKLFFLKRKRERVISKIHQSYGNKIINIEKIEQKNSICITVSNPNSLFITKNFLVTHNSWTGMCWIVFSCSIVEICA